MLSHDNLIEDFSKEEPHVDLDENDPFIIFYTSRIREYPVVPFTVIFGNSKKRK